GQRDHDAEPDPRRREPNPITHHLRYDVSAAGPERQPDPKLAPPLTHRVREEPVDPDGGEEQRGSGKAAQHPGVQLPGLEISGDVDRVCGRSAVTQCHRNVGIDLTDRPAQRREEPRWSDGRPDDESHVPPHGPREGNIDLRLGRPVEAEMMDVPHHTDHRAGERLTEVGASLDRLVQRHLATEWIQARPERACGGFIHYHGLAASWAHSGGGEIQNPTSPWGSNPGFTARSCHRLLINSPAPTTRSTARAISLVTSPARRRCRPCPVPAPAVPSFSESVRSGRA